MKLLRIFPSFGPVVSLRKPSSPPPADMIHDLLNPMGARNDFHPDSGWCYQGPCLSLLPGIVSILVHAENSLS